MGLHEQLQVLRSLTKSHALNETSIIVDASKYIEDLKRKVEKLNEDVEYNTQNLTNQLPEVNVETLETGFQINVHSEKSCPGLLVCLLQVFEDLGLTVTDGRVSCADNFQLEAIGGEDEKRETIISPQVVRKAISEAIWNWRGKDESD